MVANTELARILLFSDAELEHCHGQAFGRWRFILEDLDRRTRFEASDWEPEIELDRLHLLTVIRGLEELDQPSRVTVCTTGKSIVHSVQFGLPQWRENRWMWERFGEMVPVTDWDLWQRFDRANRIHRIQCRLAMAEDGARSPRILTPSHAGPLGGVAVGRGGPQRGLRKQAGRWARQLARVAASIAPV